MPFVSKGGILLLHIGATRLPYHGEWSTVKTASRCDPLPDLGLANGLAATASVRPRTGTQGALFRVNFRTVLSNNLSDAQDACLLFAICVYQLQLLYVKSTCGSCRRAPHPLPVPKSPRSGSKPSAALDLPSAKPKSDPAAQDCWHRRSSRRRTLPWLQNCK